MTVAQNTPINSYIGTGGTNTYPFTFPVFNSSQLLVSITNPTATQTLTLLLGINYLVSGLNASGDPASAGNITLVNNGESWLINGNLVTGWTLTIQSNFSYSQTTSIRNQGDFYRSSLENALDNLEYQIQQLYGLILLDGGGGGGSSPIVTTVILTDQVTGNTYQLLMVNGVFSTQQVGSGTSIVVILTDQVNGHTYELIMSNGVFATKQIT